MNRYGKPFRFVDPGFGKRLRRLREEGGVPVVDARDWFDDSAFHDQHHLNPEGAKAFADRFRTEALKPALTRLRHGMD